MEIGEKDTTQKDMQIFVIEQVAELVREVPQLRGREKDLKTGLLQAAGDMFLFVRLMVQDVIENKDLSLYEIERILERPPKDLNRMYEQYLVTLTKRNNQHAKAIAIRVLQWLTYAERPLTLTFLDVALALDVDDDGLDDAKRQSDILALLRRILGILVDCRRSDGNIIRAGLVHQSFKDFLRQTASDEEDLSVDLHALQHAIRPQRSHLSLLASCSSVLRASTIANPLMQYYDAVDQRRAERPRSKRLKPPEEIDHPQMGLLEIRLGEHGHRKHWKMWEYQWEIVQLEDLERTWMKREERENRARDGLQGLRGLAQVLLEVQVRWEQELVEIERLKVQQPLELEELQMLLQRPERELMVYSLRRFSAHLAGCIISHSSGHANVCLKKVLYQSLEQIVQSASAIAPSVDTQDIRWPSDVATIVNLVFALSGLESAVAQLMSSHLHLSSVAFDHSTASGQFAPQTKTIPVYCQALVSRILQTCRYFADVHIKSVYQVEVIDALREVPPRHQRPIQALLLATTRAISAFRDLEFALYRYDEQMPVAIGTSRLIYSIQCATNTLGRLGVSNLCTVLPEGHSLRRSLEDDDFLTSPALVPLQIADPRRQQPWNFDSGGNRLSAHLQVAMLCSLTVGMVNRVPLWGGVTCVALALAFFETFHPATHHPNHHLPCIVRLGARYFVLGNLVSHFGMATIVLALIFGAASVFHPTVPVNLRSLSTKRDPHPHADLIADPVAHIPGPSRHYSRWLLSKCLYIRASFCQPTTYAVMFVVLTAAACSSLARHLVSVLGITLLACDELFALLDSDGLHRASAALPQFPQRLLVFAPILRAKVHGCNVELKQCLKLMEGI
ncbi:hypothetical protein JAAARDRAFT_572376 [Jaapia argillacea MUCL 33604]|uniref:GPI inositol-deacylase winged helix domain-containing protein n=1 Tax=Jaapia argillacea MUCL 33604 TaxID=933084 RepID=A0A067Q200_9AGAM|nr:hypothetical protein JAAARDRAFT_572376 [Jaapia argillacea MUCL 33604]